MRVIDGDTIETSAGALSLARRQSNSEMPNRAPALAYGSKSPATSERSECSSFWMSAKRELQCPIIEGFAAATAIGRTTALAFAAARAAVMIVDVDPQVHSFSAHGSKSRM